MHPKAVCVRLQNASPPTLIHKHSVCTYIWANVLGGGGCAASTEKHPFVLLCTHIQGREIRLLSIGASPLADFNRGGDEAAAV